MIALLVITLMLIGLSVTPDLRSWRRRRRAAWEMERAEWREWVSRVS